MSFLEGYDLDFHKSIDGEDKYLINIAEHYLEKTDYVMTKVVESMLEISSFTDMITFFSQTVKEYSNVIAKRKEARKYLNDNRK